MGSLPAEMIGSYRLREALGSVPGGEAWRATDSRSDLEVVLKVIPGTLAGGGSDEVEPTDPAERELLDTRRLGRLDHPRIPTIYEVAEVGGSTLVAFRPVAGKTLRQYITEGGRVNRSILVDWGCQLTTLLAEAHALDVLHRHMSADAVIIDDDGQLHLTGFALTQLTSDGDELKPPELAGGMPISPGQDVYTLAALLKRLAAPVTLGGAAERALAPEDSLHQVLERATAEDPRDRFHDPSELELALREAAAVGSGGAPYATQILRPEVLREFLQALPIEAEAPPVAPGGAAGGATPTAEPEARAAAEPEAEPERKRGPEGPAETAGKAGKAGKAAALPAPVRQEPAPPRPPAPRPLSPRPFPLAWVFLFLFLGLATAAGLAWWQGWLPWPGP